MQVIKKLIDYWLGRSLLSYIFITSLFTLASSIVTANIFFLFIYLLNGADSLPSSSEPLVIPTIIETLPKFFRSVLLAPLLETLIFHSVFILLLLRVTKNKTATIIVNALLFGFLHLNTSQLAAISTTFTGCFLAFTYIHWYKKENSKVMAFVATAGVHSAHNFYYIIMSFIPASLIF